MRKISVSYIQISIKRQKNKEELIFSSIQFFEKYLLIELLNQKGYKKEILYKKYIHFQISIY